MSNNNIDLFLDELSTSASLDLAGTFTGSDTADMDSTDVSLHYGAPLLDWQRIFLSQTDGSSDITDEGVTLQTLAALNIIGDVNATSSSVSVADLYVASASLIPVYNAKVMSDISAANGDNTDPAAALHFSKELALKIFGSLEAIDMMTNEAAVAASYAVASEICSAAVSNNFSLAGGADFHRAIGDTNTAVKLMVCKKIYDQLRHTAPTRFTLRYSASATGTIADTTAAPVTGGSATSDATVNVYVTGTTIDHIEVNATGVGYVKGDVITITISVGNTITITLNSVQVAILNGTLDSPTELPLEADDMFHVKYLISSNASQANVSGTTFDAVTTSCDMHITLRSKWNILWMSFIPVKIYYAHFGVLGLQL